MLAKPFFLNVWFFFSNAEEEEIALFSVCMFSSVNLEKGR